MKIIYTNGFHDDFVPIFTKLDNYLNETMPERKEAGLNSIYNINTLRDIFLMYDDDRNAIGSAGLWCHDDEDCELIRVYVDSAHRGQGLAKQLVDRVEELAIKRGYKHIFLRTWERTKPALRLYEKLGYKRIPSEDFKYSKANKFPSLAHMWVYMQKQLS